MHGSTYNPKLHQGGRVQIHRRCILQCLSPFSLHERTKSRCHWDNLKTITKNISLNNASSSQIYRIYVVCGFFFFTRHINIAIQKKKPHRIRRCLHNKQKLFKQCEVKMPCGNHLYLPVWVCVLSAGQDTEATRSLSVSWRNVNTFAPSPNIR